MTIKGLIGVAISTTGHEHRMEFLETVVRGWRRVLPLGSVLLVTVDGTDEDAARVARVTHDALSTGGNVYHVGQDFDSSNGGFLQIRQGVAVNKNTGIELLMQHNVEHLFLSDDDIYPLYPQALDKHIGLGLHSMVCWGKSRFDYEQSGYAAWKWPRGVMLYCHRRAIETVGGFVEDFGIGGHEHVEFSQRIHNAGMTEEPFLSPASYATRSATGARALWEIADMPRVNEPRHIFAGRKHASTTLHQSQADWERAERVMSEQQGSSAFVPYWAHDNGRASATLCAYTPSQGAEDK